MLLSGLAIFTVASLLCAQASDANTLIIFRALQAFGSGAAIVMARAIARDVYPANELPKVLSLMTLVTMIAPLLAPLLGGFLLIHFQWQAIFYLLALIGTYLPWRQFFSCSLKHYATSGALRILFALLLKTTLRCSATKKH